MTPRPAGLRSPAPGDLTTSALRTVTAGWLALRLVAASKVGFGDSEALYASYALHPQPAYLDHPGLVGLFARLVGGGTAPGPERAHLFTAFVSVVVPWAMAALCRACGATPRRAAAAALLFAFVPEIAVGLFALTPDLLLAPAWIAALTCAAVGLRAKPGSGRASFAFAAAGLLAGTATAAKVSGALLLVALAASYLAPPARAHARTFAPWGGLLAGLVVVAPIVVFESKTMGWPMLTHRLVDTQHAAGLSLRNLGMLARRPARLRLARPRGAGRAGGARSLETAARRRSGLGPALVDLRHSLHDARGALRLEPYRRAALARPCPAAARAGARARRASVAAAVGRRGRRGGRGDEPRGLRVGPRPGAAARSPGGDRPEERHRERALRMAPGDARGAAADRVPVDPGLGARRRRGRRSALGGLRAARGGPARRDTRGLRHTHARRLRHLVAARPVATR